MYFNTSGALHGVSLLTLSSGVLAVAYHGAPLLRKICAPNKAFSSSVIQQAVRTCYFASAFVATTTFCVAARSSDCSIALQSIIVYLRSHRGVHVRWPRKAVSHRRCRGGGASRVDLAKRLEEASTLFFAHRRHNLLSLDVALYPAPSCSIA